VPVLALLRQPGTRRPLHLEAVVGELRVGEAWVPADQSVTVDVVAEATGGDTLTVDGEVRAPYRAHCRRCLEELDAELASEVREIFERRPVEGETYPLTGEVIDLGPLVRDAVLLALPLAPLCRDDCGGPLAAPRPSGVPRPAVPQGAAADEPVLDPRWAALRELDLG
jgi:uncharacterized protein